MSALTISKEDEKRVKGMGFLNNRGTDLFSARILTVNGKVTAAQHHCMADAAEKFGMGICYTPHGFLLKFREFPMIKLKSFRNLSPKKA